MSEESEPLLGDRPDPSQQSTKITLKFAILLSMLWFGTFIAAADSTIVSTLMASIASDLEALDSISWVATAYLVAYSAFQPLYGKMSDIIGRKYVLLTSTLVFGIGCLVCSIAQSMTILVVGRVLNGIGAGGMMGMSVIVVSDHVTSRERGVYSGLGNLAFATGAALGGVIGGLAESYKGWRFAFSLQVPLCLVSMVLVSFNMSNYKPSKPQQSAHLSPLKRIDFVGSWTLATSVCLLMLAVTLGGTRYPWASLPIAGLAIVSAVFMAFFIWWEIKMALEPVLPVHVLSEKTVLCNCINLFFTTGCAYTFTYYVPLYLSAVLDFTPRQISARMLAQFIGGSIGSLGGGYLIQRSGRYYKIGVCATIGLLCSSLIWTLIVAKDIEWSWLQVGAYGVQGMAVYAVLTTALVSMMAAVPDHQSVATSAQYTFRGVGSSLLLAFSGAIFNQQLKAQLVRHVPSGAEDVIGKVSKSIEAIRKLPLALQGPVIESYKDSVQVVFTVACGLSIVSVFCSLLIQEKRL